MGVEGMAARVADPSTLPVAEAAGAEPSSSVRAASRCSWRAAVGAPAACSSGTGEASPAPRRGSARPTALLGARNRSGRLQAGARGAAGAAGGRWCRRFEWRRAGKGPAVGVGVFGDGGDGAESPEGGGGGGGGGYYGGGGGGGGGWEVDSEQTGGGAGGGGGQGFISPCLTNRTSRSPQEALSDGYAELSYTPGAGAAQAAGGCEGQLKVFIKIVGPIANVGTRSGLAVNDDDPKDGPVHFTVPIGSTTETEYAEANEAGQKCESGCANLLVTVINQQTGKPAANATVNADLGQIDTAGSPNLDQIGHSSSACNPTARPLPPAGPNCRP